MTACGEPPELAAYRKSPGSDDAFLRARAGGGEAKVEKPKGFVESPEVQEADLHALAYALCRGTAGDTEGA